MRRVCLQSARCVPAIGPVRIPAGAMRDMAAARPRHALAVGTRGPHAWGRPSSSSQAGVSSS